MKGTTREGLRRLKEGHPWVYAGHLTAEFPEFPQAGYVFTERGCFAYSPQSEIRLRQFAALKSIRPPVGEFWSKPSDFTADAAQTLTQHFETCLRAKRAALGGEECLRWIFSECDGVPGLVVDLLGFDVVAQIQTAPTEMFWPIFKTALAAAATAVLGRAPFIHELRSTSARKHEGLEVIAPAKVESEQGRWQKWNGLEWFVNPGAGQKTGAYLDQRDNHRAAVEWALRYDLKNAWDLCCFEGGFGLHLAQAGLEVMAFDQSATALEAARRNATRNGLSEERFRTEEGDVFDFLKQKSKGRQNRDLIVLDPPGFVRSRRELEGALRGFKEINLRALQCLKPGGLLISCGCSHHVGPADYRGMLMEAAADARRTVKVLEIRGPSLDHAPLIGFAESNYLQAWYLQVE